MALEPVNEREWEISAAGFARERDAKGEFFAVATHVAARCFFGYRCDEKVQKLMWRAEALARNSGDLLVRQQLEIWKMKLALTLDDLATAEEAEVRLLALGEPVSPWTRSQGLQARAHRAMLVRDYRRVQELYRALLEFFPPGDPHRAPALGGYAAGTAQLALQGLESREAAERALREAITEAERVQLFVWDSDIGYFFQRIQLALLLGTSTEAVAILRSVLEGWRKEMPAATAWVRPLYPEIALAELLSTVDPPRIDEALGLAEASVGDGEALGKFESVRALLLRSRIRFRSGDFWLARADGLAALEKAEQLRELQGSISTRSRYAESFSFAYRSVAGCLLAHRTPDDVSAVDEAFQVMERIRARGLMEGLLSLPEGKAPGEPPALQPPTLVEMQNALRSGEALLSFEIWHPEPSIDAPYRDGSSWVTVATRERVSSFRIPNGDELEPQIRAWTGLLERRDGSDRGPGARLFEELLGPVIATLPREIDRLVVIPDGPVHRLPLDALSAGPGGPYVAERFTISVQPSAALWLRMRAAPKEGPGRLLVLADPAGPASVLAVRRDAASVLGALEHARQEGEVALSTFPAGSELRTGLAASEAFLKNANLDGVSLIHFATHARVDVRDPEHSAVLLAAGGPNEDGRLEPAEISHLGLRGRTVVLAACETSAGPVYRGEGVMSLARAFFAAGARAVVGTLDRTRDEEAGLFFSAFYDALRLGASVGDAVAVAKRERIRHGGPPAAWADVVVLGDADARPRERGISWLVPAAVGGLVLTLAGLGAGRRWRSRRPKDG
jgi:CHAT domain-containing protein